jgi:calmodulin
MTESISQAQLLEYSEAFELYDQSGNGTIPVAQIGFVTASLGQKIPAATLEAIQKRKLADGETTVTFEEFLFLMQTGGTTSDYEDDKVKARSRTLKAALGLFDPSQSGTISIVDLRKALRDVMKETEIEGLIKKADPNGSGRVDCGYLAELMTGS